MIWSVWTGLEQVRLRLVTSWVVASAIPLMIIHYLPPISSSSRISSSGCSQTCFPPPNLPWGFPECSQFSFYQQCSGTSWPSGGQWVCSDCRDRGDAVPFFGNWKRWCPFWTSEKKRLAFNDFLMIYVLLSSGIRLVLFQNRSISSFDHLRLNDLDAEHSGRQLDL